MSMLANKIKNINIKKIFDLLLLDKRWSGKPSNMSRYVFPGVGFGGYCLPKDLSALIDVFNKNKVKPRLLSSVNNVNYEIKKFNLKIIKSKILKKKRRLGSLDFHLKKDLTM